ncbi:MAG: hypothetical protein Q8859_07915, partial [Bacteroidota bacterium]|nr:hypothetical protein [Bacteroidota bacterium]
WVYNWWNIFKDINNNTYGHNKSLAIITISTNGKIQLIAPLVKVYRKMGPFKVSFIEFIGQQWGATSISFLKDRNFSITLKEIIAFLNKNISYDIFHIRQIPFDDEPEYSITLKPYSGCPYIKIADYNTFDEYKDKIYSRKLKHYLRTSYNRMERDDIKTETSVDQITDENLKEIVRLSMSKIQDQKKCVYCKDEKLNFYTRIFKAFPSNIIFIKTINGVNLAYRINVFYQNIKTCIDTSFDRDYKMYNLGIITVDQNIHDSFENPITIHSMGPGMEDYKQKFCPDVQLIGRYIQKGNTILSNVYNPLFCYITEWNDHKKEKLMDKKDFLTNVLISMIHFILSD